MIVAKKGLKKLNNLQTFLACFLIILFSGIAFSFSVNNRELLAQEVIKSPFAVPRDTAIDEKNNIVYVASYLSDEVVILDGISKSVLGSIAIDRPTSLILDEVSGKLFILSFDRRILNVVDMNIIASKRTSDFPKSIVRTINLGGNPRYFYIDSEEGFGFIVLERKADNIVAVISLDSLDLIKEIIVDSSEIADIGLDRSLHRLYLAGLHNRKFYVISTRARDNFDLSELALGRSIKRFAIDANTHKLYGISSGGDVVKINVVTGIIENALDAGFVTGNRVAINVNPDLQRVYAVSFFHNTISIIDSLAWEVIRVIPIDSRAHPSAVVVDESRDYAYVFSQKREEMYIIDSSDDLIKTMFIRFLPEYFEGFQLPTLNSTTGEVYYASTYHNVLNIFSPITFSISIIPKLPDGKFFASIDERLSTPFGAPLFNENKDKIYTYTTSGFLRIIDVSSGKVLKSLFLGENLHAPFGVTKYKKIYIISNYEKALYVVSTETNEIMKRIPLGDETARDEYLIGYDFRVQPFITIPETQSAYDNHIFFMDINGEELFVVDQKNDVILKRLTGFDHVNEHGFELDEERRKAYFVLEEGVLKILDLDFFTVNSINLPLELRGHSFLQRDHDSGKLLIANSRGVYEIDVAGGEVEKKLSVERRSGGVNGFAASDGKIYIGSSYRLDIYDADSGRYITSIPTKLSQNHIHHELGDELYIFSHIIGSEGALYRINKENNSVEEVATGMLTTRSLPVIIGNDFYYANPVLEEIVVVDNVFGVNTLTQRATKRNITYASVVIFIVFLVGLGVYRFSRRKLQNQSLYF